jgi:hypothetical protein
MLPSATMQTSESAAQMTNCKRREKAGNKSGRRGKFSEDFRAPAVD